MNSLPTRTIAPTELLAALNWRYATKKFDPARKIPAELWNALEDALVLSPSSIGLQPWKFLVVTDAAVRARLRAAARDQPQVTDSSHYVVLAVRRNLGAEHVARHIDRMAAVRGVPPESLARLAEMARGAVEEARGEGRLDVWQTHQLYIALGSFMTAAALLGVDTCPMEGFEPERFDEILGLAGTDFASVVSCAAGYRAPDDKYATAKKVRFPRSELIVQV